MFFCFSINTAKEPVFFFSTKNMFPIVQQGTRWPVDRATLTAAFKIAAARYHQNRQQNILDKRFCQRKSQDIELQGLLGEKAFIALFHSPDDTHDTTCRNVCNDTFDARVGGFTVDVKTTRAVGNGILVMASKRKNPPDLFALMYLRGDPIPFEMARRICHPAAHEEAIDLPQLWLEFVGFIPSKELFQDTYLNQQSFTTQPAYYARLNDLCALHEIIWDDPGDAPFITPLSTTKSEN